MDDLTGLYAFNRVHKRREKRAVVLHPVPLHMDDDDSESELLEIVLVLKTLVDSHENVALALSLSDQPGIGQRAPFRFSHGQDFMIGEGLPQAGIDALV